MSFKVGDKVRVVGSEKIGTVIEVIGNLSYWRADFDDWRLNKRMAEALGITLERVNLFPEEPPVGSVIRLGGDVYEHVSESSPGWAESGIANWYSWEELCDFFGTDFIVLEDRDKTIRAVLAFMEEKRWTYQPMIIAEHFGVSLDD